MKIPYLFALTFLVLLLFAFVKNNNQIEIFTEQVKIDSVITFEKSLNANAEFLNMNVFLSTNSFPQGKKYKMAKPLIVKREQRGILPIYAEYFYSVPDSILRYVSYDWERDKYGNFNNKKKIWEEESGKLDAYNQEYETIKTNLRNRFGKPVKEDIGLQKVKTDSKAGFYYTRECYWETPLYHAELVMIFEAMTYRINFTYYWKT